VSPDRFAIPSPGYSYSEPLQFCRWRDWHETVRDAAYAIIARKGYINTAIGVAIVRLVAAILDDQRSVLPVSRHLSGEYGGYTTFGPNR
jgi:L-lactate dehydrogenase